MKILLELRPALDGHAGIPQETRLLFRGLRMIAGLDVEGMIIHSGRVLAKGLPADPAYRSRPQSADREIYKLSRTIISLQEIPPDKISEMQWVELSQLLASANEVGEHHCE